MWPRARRSRWPGIRGATPAGFWPVGWVRRQRGNEATRQRGNKATRQRGNEATRQRGNKATRHKATRQRGTRHEKTTGHRGWVLLSRGPWGPHKQNMARDLFSDKKRGAPSVGVENGAAIHRLGRLTQIPGDGGEGWSSSWAWRVASDGQARGKRHKRQEATGNGAGEGRE